MSKDRKYLKKLAEYSYIKYENGHADFYCRVCTGKNFHYGSCPMPEILEYLELKEEKSIKDDIFSKVDQLQDEIEGWHKEKFPLGSVPDKIMAAITHLRNEVYKI